MDLGKVYKINNHMQHSVMKKAREGRINFIFDYVPPQNIGAITLEGETAVS